MDQLLQRVSDLTSENKSLRDQVAWLQEQVKQLRSRRIVQTQPGQPGRQVPGNWVPREFNGRRTTSSPSTRPPRLEGSR